LQSIANQAIENSFIQYFKVIYLDVRSLIVGDLVKNQITRIKPYFHINNILTNFQLASYNFKSLHLQTATQGNLLSN